MDYFIKFDNRYHERVWLPDGRELLLRLVRADDKERLQKGFRNLSPNSRYKRFLATKQSLTNEKLDYDTEIDQDKHFALSVMELTDSSGEGDGIGIARFIRYSDDDTKAKVAASLRKLHRQIKINNMVISLCAI